MEAADITEKTVPVKRVEFDTNLSVEENFCDETEEENFDFMKEETATEEPTPVTAYMEVPHFSIKLCGNLNQAEQDFVDIMLHDFYMSYEHTKATVTCFDVCLGGLLVEDLLQDPNSSYRHLMSSSVPRRHKLRERSLSAFPTLSTSCPSVSDVGLNFTLSSSLPSYSSRTFQRHGPVRPLSPLRPLIKRQRVSSLTCVNTIAEGDDTEHDSTSKSSKEEEKEDSALVHIKVVLVDKNDEGFHTKFNSVRI